METESVQSEKIYFPNLDPIRFLAAFMIVILHAYEAWCGWFGSGTAICSGTGFSVYIDRFLRNFGFGVDIFFFLSGFLITYILIKEKEKTNKIDFKKYFIRRVLRIWPLYFFLIIISPLIMWWLDTPADDPNYLVNILFVNNFDTIYCERWVYPFAHFWSICIEEHFYLIWPFVIAFIPNKKLPITFILLILGCIGFRMYVAIFDENPWYSLFMHTFSKADVLILGAFLAYFYAKKPFTVKIPLFIRIAVYLVLLFSLAWVAVYDWQNAFLAGFKNYFFIGLTAVAMINYNFNPDAFMRFKPTSIFHYLGKTSYGIYMYGNIVNMIIIEKIIVYWNIYNLYLYWGLIISISLLVPILSYELMEKPILKFKNRFSVIKTGK